MNAFAFLFVARDWRTESLKLQRNTENYLYLRCPQASVIGCDQSDKDEFINTKVIDLIHRFAVYGA